MCVCVCGCAGVGVWGCGGIYTQHDLVNLKTRSRHTAYMHHTYKHTYIHTHTHAYIHTYIYPQPGPAVAHPLSQQPPGSALPAMMSGGSAVPAIQVLLCQVCE